MRYPKSLRTGEIIEFIAPSFGCTTEPYKTCFDSAIKKFKALGYKIKEGENCRVDKGIGISNTPSACGRELNNAFEDESDVIISCGGGELMCQVIPYIDFEKIAANPPKWYLGYSDNTNYVILSATLSDTAAIYGPCAPSFGMETWHKCLKDAIGVMTGEITTVTNYDSWELESLKDEDHPLVPYNLTNNTDIKCYTFPDQTTIFCALDENTPPLIRTSADLSFSGRLIGGCIDCLTTLCGTKYDKVREFDESYKEDGIIFFMESCDLNPISLRRAVWQLREAGWFEHVKGFLIGRPYHYGEEAMGLTMDEAMLGILKDLRVPVLMDLDIGHLPPAMPIVVGAKAQVSYKEGGVTIDYPELRERPL